MQQRDGEGNNDRPGNGKIEVHVRFVRWISMDVIFGQARRNK
jgi:hypothetical protein